MSDTPCASKTSMIVPSSVHRPTRLAFVALQIGSGAPPARGIFWSCPSLKKPIQRPSGEKNAPSAPSVPASGRASNEFSSRTTSRRSAPTNSHTTAIPSGAIASLDGATPCSGSP